MKLPRASMTTTLFVILVLVVDARVARDLLLERRGWTSAVGLGLLPIATALTFGLYRLVRLRGQSLPFTLGFEAAGGVAAVGLACLVARDAPPGAVEAALGAVDRTFDAAARALLPREWLAGAAVEAARAAAILSLPPSLVGLLGGAVARRLVGRRGDRDRAPKARPAKARFGLRGLMIAVAAAAAVIAYAGRRARYEKWADYHFGRSTAKGVFVTLPGGARALQITDKVGRWHAERADRYERAALRPWMTVPPEAPPPDPIRPARDGLSASAGTRARR